MVNTQCDTVLQNCTPETQVILLTIITPINLIIKRDKITEHHGVEWGARHGDSQMGRRDGRWEGRQREKSHLSRALMSEPGYKGTNFHT